MPFGFEAEGEIPSSKPHNGEPFRALHLLRRLIIATGNPIKVAEIEAMLGPLPIEVQHQPDDLDVEETGSTYLENASLKASAAALRTKTWALADDSGLEVMLLAEPQVCFPPAMRRATPRSFSDSLVNLANPPTGVPVSAARW